MIFPHFIPFTVLTESIWLHILNSGPEAAITYQFSVYSLNTSYEESIPCLPFSNQSYFEEQYCMQVSQYITIHKAAKQIWYIVSKSYMCNTVLFLPYTQHNDGCKQEMYKTRHSWTTDTRHWEWYTFIWTHGHVLTDIHYTQWIDSMQCWPSVQFTPAGYDKTNHPILLKTLPHSTFSHTSSLKICIQWWKRYTDIITSISTNRMKYEPYCLIWCLKETYLLLSIIVQMWHEKREIQCNITNPHYMFLRPLSEKKRNMTNSIIHWDLHILVTTKTNLTWQMKIMNGYGSESYI
jgi:hypothetical protein